MLETVEISPGKFSGKATVGRLGIYLDNFAIIDLAKGDAGRRERFIRTLHRGADLMFSPTNAAEILGPECQSSIGAVSAFLDAIGPHWFPIEGTDVVKVLEREATGADKGEACTSEWFLQMFFAAHNLVLHGEQRMGMVEPQFFRLGFVLEWLRPRREEIRNRLAAFDDRLRAVITQFRRAYDGNHLGFEDLLPRRPFDATRPATFAWEGLVRYDEPALAALIIAIATINAWNRLNVATRQVAGSASW